MLIKVSSGILKLRDVRKIPNISPGRIEVRKHFWWAYMRGLIFGGAYIRKDFELKGDLRMPKNSAFGVQSERLIITFNA